jgi:hypothetical protein
VVVGEDPVVQIDEGYVDDVRRRTVSSYAWSTSTTASWRSSEVRLEMVRRRCASVVEVALKLLQV